MSNWDITDLDVTGITPLDVASVLPVMTDPPDAQHPGGRPLESLGTGLDEREGDTWIQLYVPLGGDPGGGLPTRAVYVYDHDPDANPANPGVPAQAIHNLGPTTSLRVNYLDPNVTNWWVKVVYISGGGYADHVTLYVAAMP